MEGQVEVRGTQLLHDPRLNRGTGISAEDRRRLKLEGLLPPNVDSLDIQLARVHAQLDHLDGNLQKYLYLTDLQSRSEALFFATVMSDPAGFMPIVYTPTVGEACQKFDHNFRGTRGMYLPITAAGRLDELLANWHEPDVRFIVVTDGERILGLGDLGVGGMGIPVGKLTLYTACAGVPPQYTMPVTLDVGTDNHALVQDPLYLGLRQPRVRGEAYSTFIDEFVSAVGQRFPNCCIQWEDFANTNAVPILEKYRDAICTYNDDIQGTAAIALAGIYGALRISQQKLTDQRILFLGAGSAAMGISELLTEAMVAEGLPENDARLRSWLFDVNGLLVSSRTDLPDYQRRFVHDHPQLTSFLDAVRTLRPTAIIGVSTVPKLFNQAVIRAMAEINERPMIFPYSNPTSRSECSAEEAYTWSDGRAIFAAGSPFDPVQYRGKTFIPGQGNNVYIFPAMGMAIYATNCRRVPQELFIVAARAVADQVTEADLAAGLIYPPQSHIFEASLNVASVIAESIFDRGLARVPRPENIPAHIRSLAYTPQA